MDQFKQMDTKELEFPDTVFVRDIETRVFQAIAIHCISQIKDVSLPEGNILDNLLGREGLERIKGIHVEQDLKSHSVNLKIELSIAYGISIPQKSEEIQNRIVSEIVRLTGLHVASVHLVFKNLIPDAHLARILSEQNEELAEEVDEELLEQYSQEF